ncbi:Core-2/I-branching beta-16-N-acetylglucosaminyltransferase family protein [Citrus sinensis]|uniref:Core-2/I-branching beta-16-N-acetylglucosaminyltransferase family protein n=1 Tax=Citrus sinensis TaxID=2711 RepID=A0ACB8P716_CITSI|nr:Core-2/I-branching beta-16-N-acetylglucosaminyltransferase family protein [Citrus sinensis]
MRANYYPTSPYLLANKDYCFTFLGLLVSSFFHAQKYNSGCYIFFTSSGCRSAFSEAAAPVILRENKQMAYRLVIKETSNPAQSKNPKIASMFLTQGSLPFELLWDKFSMYVIPVNGTFCHLWRGHEGRFSVYKYPGLHGNGRYSESMLPEAELKDLRKGVQLFMLIGRKWHPKSYSGSDVSYDLLKNIMSLRHFRETFLIVDKCHIVRQNLKIFSFPLDNTEDSADAALPVERSQTAALLIRREILS